MFLMMVQLLNQITDFNKIRYKHYAISGHSNLILFKFPIIGKNNLANTQICEVGSTPVPLNVKSWKYDIIFKNYLLQKTKQFWQNRFILIKFCKVVKVALRNFSDIHNVDITFMCQELNSVNKYICV